MWRAKRPGNYEAGAKSKSMRRGARRSMSDRVVGLHVRHSPRTRETPRQTKRVTARSLQDRHWLAKCKAQTPLCAWALRLTTGSQPHYSCSLTIMRRVCRKEGDKG
eukprot:6205817-Pleurochrysis_carterae.AAC.3